MGRGEGLSDACMLRKAASGERMNRTSVFYQAYCYHGQTLLASDKCGEAIRSLQEAEKRKFSCQSANSLFKNKCLTIEGRGN